MRIIPIYDRVLIRYADPPTETKGGLALPDTSHQKPMRGYILETGEGYLDTESGRIQPLNVAKGDEVIFNRYAGVEIELEDENAYECKYAVVMREVDIIAVVSRTRRAK